MSRYGLQAEEGRKTRRAAVNARKAMARDDGGGSSVSSDDSDHSADVHMSTSDEEGTESGNAEEVRAAVPRSLHPICAGHRAQAHSHVE